MTFGGNTQPKKKPKKPAGSPWVCGCKISQPAYIGFCKSCGKGQAQ